MGARATIVRTYGGASFLGFLSPMLAAFMAGRGLDGIERSARRAMEDDAVAMQTRGYRVGDAIRYRLPLGISWFQVTYVRDDAAASE